jgi:hypothetical protein
MRLLYCVNGVVQAIHDDTQDVAASTYTGARIIPYDDPLDTLTRVGTPPVQPPPGSPLLPVPDTRPYAEPAPVQKTLLAYAAQLRFSSSNDGVSFTAASGPIPVATDRTSQMLLGNLAAYAATLAPTAAVDFTQDSVHYPITATECKSMFNAVYAHVQQCRTIEASCITDLNSPTPTIATYADVEAKFSSVRGGR